MVSSSRDDVPQDETITSYDVRFGHGHQPVAVAGNGLVLRHIVAAGVAIQILDVPALRLQELVSLDDSEDGAGGGGVIVRVPAEIERMADGLYKVTVTVHQRRDRGGAVEPDPVAVAPVVPAIAAVPILGEPAGNAPVLGVLARPLAHVGDD